MEKLIEEIIKTNSAYKFLRLKQITYFAKGDCCKILFLFPNQSPYIDNPKAVFKDIKNIASRLTGIETTCEFSKVSVLEELVIMAAQSFIKTELNSTDFFAENIKFTQGEQNKVSIYIDKLYFDYALSKGLDKILQEHLSDNFCADFEVELFSKEEDIDFSKILTSEPSKIERHENLRVIVPESVNTLLGKEIKEPAVYIKDLNMYAGYETVVCGTIKGLKRFTYKSKKTPEDGKEKVYFKFFLNDFTGSTECVFFAHSASLAQAEKLADDTEIIVKGKAEQGKYSLNMNIKSISYCIIPKNLVEVKHRNSVPENYTVIKPEPITVTEQVNIFTQQILPQEILANIYVVFDLETTGIGENDRITEIAAVKIKEGKISEVFTTLINPKMHIPQETIKLNGIDDEMVARSPVFEEVAGDFYKFCDGCILVGHNVSDFDLPFINRYSDTTHYYYDLHKVEDTLEISRRKLKNKLNNYKLTTVAAYFNIVNIMAHRAQFDALTTAKVFLELSKLPD